MLKRGLSRSDEALLYEELELRANIIKHWIDKGLFNYYDVYGEITRVEELGLDKYVERIGVKA